MAARRSLRGYALGSAAPTIDLRPTASVVEVHVRYITRATSVMLHARGCIASDISPIDRRFYRRPLSAARHTVQTVTASEIPMVGYESRLLSRVEVAQDTMAFHFEKPAGFDFKPGQSVDLTLINPPETDSEGNTRTFSIACATLENQLIFATRMRDTAFKRSLKKVALGTVVKMDSAMGSFTLHKNSAKPAVFLAGGIGITPFSSIVRQADHDRAPSHPRSVQVSVSGRMSHPVGIRVERDTESDSDQE